MTFEELQRLLDPEVQAVIDLHSAEDSVTFALQFHSHKDIPVRAIAEQLACRQKAAKKLPNFFRHNLLYTPLALEQASGELTAQYKTSLMSGKRMIDLSGGLGADSMFLSRVFQEVVYCERDALLCALFQHNLKKSGITNVQVKNADSIDLLASYPDDFFDWIYVDPARREQGRRSIGLESASPDVVAGHDTFLRKARRICVKASPALEVTGLKKLLPSLQSIIVVSVDSECKEILLLLDRSSNLQQPLMVKAICLSSASEVEVEVIGNSDVEKTIASSLKKYFYEPDAAIIKAKLTSKLAGDFGFEFMNKTVDYLTSDMMVETFPGKTFRMIECILYKPKTFKAFLKRHDIVGASIQRRDFPLSPEELRKQYRLLESDRAFLFFSRDVAGRPVSVYCIRCFPADAEVLFVQDQNATPEC
ncbi:MAG: class I SAM-dependent methyltransferase [Chlorobiales bacterium]|nr:class I SAM-dependent methyltransferase [Chlorobiales bacterium]